MLNDVIEFCKKYKAAHLFCGSDSFAKPTVQTLKSKRWSADRDAQTFVVYQSTFC